MYDWQGGGLFTLVNAACGKSDLSPILYQTGSVTDQAARHRELSKRVHGRNRMACSECNDPLNPGDEKRISLHEQRPGSCLNRTREGGIDFAIGICFQYLNLW